MQSCAVRHDWNEFTALLAHEKAGILHAHLLASLQDGREEACSNFRTENHLNGDDRGSGRWETTCRGVAVHQPSFHSLT
jgi:hypothetical protein